MNLKGAIFDFNGTLLWDTGLHNQAWDKYLTKYGLKLSDEEKNRVIHGRNNELIFPDIFNKTMTQKEISLCVSEKEAMYRVLCIQCGITFAPGSVELIGYLRNHNIITAIATASGKENVDFYLDFLKLDSLIDKNLIIYNNGQFKSKPDPDIFLYTINQMGLKPHEVAIFEDSVAGVEAADRAKAGKIYVVNSTGNNKSHFGFEVITHFNQVNRNLFKE